ncbi:hypothetical protein [Halalkalicoccus sp. NIPERK01]|uniref:DUF7845 domain-containing protein n=1 Tax=Halalkalicoccus sp. NIPERK01 TaxID=3053469 RepID=UPI00256F5A76|nr:hypothetical protein [Halalkalicoccus sp. NIPERK01]MDL5360397.1 hypothetical protein [Halalkalicoccus sp. NIPERK01]
MTEPVVREGSSNRTCREQSTDATPTEGLSVITPAPHEVSGHLIFTDEGLLPYYELHAITYSKGHYEATEGTFGLAGEIWSVELTPKESGLKPRDDPEFELKTVKEYVLRVAPEDADDQIAPPAVTFQVAPRWPEMEFSPDIVGVNVRFDGSNLPLETYPVLLQRAMAAVGLTPDSFAEIHPYSNIWRFERYVRVQREKATVVIGSNGPLERIFEHVSSKGNFRELREDDRKRKGYYHRVKFDSRGASALLSGHTLGKQVKHYHPKNVHGDAGDPLYHPKVSVCYLSKQTDDGAVKWDDRDVLQRELDETLINVLSWAGLPTQADPSVYVEDVHFDVTESKRALRLIDDPLPEIRRTQNATVIEGISANPNLTHSDMDALEVLADGGAEMPVGTLADDAGVSKRTIYRTVERLNGVLEVHAGSVGFASAYIRDTVRGLLSDVADSIRADDAVEDTQSAWAQFKARYGVEVKDDRNARLQLRFGKLPRGRSLTDILKDGFFAYPGDEFRFKNARITYKKDGRTQVLEGFDPLQ